MDSDSRIALKAIAQWLARQCLGNDVPGIGMIVETEK